MKYQQENENLVEIREQLRQTTSISDFSIEAGTLLRGNGVNKIALMKRKRKLNKNEKYLNKIIN